MTTAPLPPLPSLPPLPDMDDATWHPGGPSMIEILAAEHQVIRGLAEQLRSAPDQVTRDVTRDVLVATVSRHLSAEQQYLYPTVRSTLPDGAELADGELAADRDVQALLLRLAPPTRMDEPAIDELLDALDAHARRVDSTIAPRLADACQDNELVRLGNRILVAEEAAPTRPHPAAPTTPPANKIVAPALGVMDKVRDLVSGRTTYPADLPGAADLTAAGQAPSDGPAMTGPPTADPPAADPPAAPQPAASQPAASQPAQTNLGSGA